MAQGKPVGWDLSDRVRQGSLSSLVVLRDSEMPLKYFCPRQRKWHGDIKNTLESLGCCEALPGGYGFYTRRHKALV